MQLNLLNNSESNIKNLMSQLLSGVKYLHDLGIAHRDLKLDNIMMTSSDCLHATPKLIDFGLSKVFTPHETSTDPFGTLAYCAPEVILQKPHRKNLDVWSLGVLLHVLLTNNFPFIVNDRKQTCHNIVH